jgi:hypothetical protein
MKELKITKKKAAEFFGSAVGIKVSAIKPKHNYYCGFFP